MTVPRIGVRYGTSSLSEKLSERVKEWPALCMVRKQAYISLFHERGKAVTCTIMTECVTNAGERSLALGKYHYKSFSRAAVLSFCPNVCVKQVVADIARPAMMIWGPIQWGENKMEGQPV